MAVNLRNNGINLQKKNLNSIFANYISAIKDTSYALENRIKIIFSGRQYANACMNIYKENSNSHFLLRILDVHYRILPYYLDTTFSNNVTDVEKYLINDKCKYYFYSILVMFYLNMMKDIKDELVAFKRHLQVFSKYCRSEYSLVLEDMQELYNSSTLVSVCDENKVRIDIHYEIGLHPYELKNDFPSESLRLHRAVIACSSETQVPVSQMTIDMFRMSKAIEWNPRKINDLRVKNCRKWTFYNRGFWEVEKGINDATHNISPNGILLLYVNGDAYEKIDSNVEASIGGQYRYGVKMRQEVKEGIAHSKVECLYPGDVVSMLLVPTVLVVDSAASHAFLGLHKTVDKPVITLLSPSEWPEFIAENQRHGSLYSLFLTSPPLALCRVCCHHRPTYSEWRVLLRLIEDFMSDCLSLLSQWHDRTPPPPSGALLGDPVARALLLRHLLALVVLRLHAKFDRETHYPQSGLTNLESQALASKTLQTIVYRLFVVSSDLSTSGESIDVERCPQHASLSP